MNELINQAAIKEGSQAAFTMAIELGLLSTEPESEFYAAKYMYMGEGRFKNINLRNYIN